MSSLIKAVGNLLSKKEERPPQDSEWGRMLVSVHCDMCGTKVNDLGKHWYHCTECSGFDACDNCFQNHTHPHYMPRIYVTHGRAHSIITSFRTVQGSMKASFALYDNRPLFGIYREESCLCESSARRDFTVKNLEDENDIELIVLRESMNEEGRIEWITYCDVYDRMVSNMIGMRDICGIRRGDFVGICASTILEFFLLDYAIILLGAVLVPIPTNFDDEGLQHVISSTRLTCIFCEREFTERFLKYKIELNLPLVRIVEIDRRNQLRPPAPRDMKDETEADGVKMTLHSHLEAYGRKKSKEECDLHKLDPQKLIEMHDQENSGDDPEDYTEKAERRRKERKGKKVEKPSLVDRNQEDLTQADQIFTIIFTSGSTGVPKGAVFNNATWNDSTKSKYRSRFDTPVAVSWAPLFHSSGKRHVLADIYHGGRIGILSRGMANIFDDIQLIGPTHVSSTPRLWNVLYHQFGSELATLATEAKAQEGTEEYKAIRKQLMNHYGKKLGKRVWTVGSGGAPTSQEVLHFLKECFKCTISNGYGATETGSIQSGGQINLEDGVQYRIADVPELNYFTTDRPHPRGELVVKTKTMVVGYWDNDKLNEESFTSDGYFKTGDIVELNGPNQVKIIDRKKAFFKLAQGEFVAPEKLEIIYVSSAYIEQIWVTGDMLQSYIVAVIVPNFANVSSALNVSLSNEQLIQRQKCKDLIFEDMIRLAQEEHLATYEIPLKFHLSDQVWTVANGLLTSTSKLARGQMRTHFKTVVDGLYSDSTQTLSIEQKEYNTNLFTSIASQVLGLKALGEGDNLVSLGLDSLAAVSICKKLKAKTGVEVPISVIYGASDVSSINEYIQHKSEEIRTSTEEMNVDFRRELETLLQESQLIERVESHMKRAIHADVVSPVFLTGATGFLGAFLLAELLKRDPNMVVFCLVRVSPSTKEQDKQQIALEKIKSNLKYYGIWSDLMTPNIQPVAGDLKQPFFGMSEKSFNDMGENIMSILHCGGWVNSIFDYQTMKSSNVNGTLEVVRLAMKSRFAVPIHFISTMSAAFKLKAELLNPGVVHTLDDEFLLAKMSRGYGQSKWMAERIIMAIHQHGFPAIIYQPGTIGGDNRSGDVNPTDYIMQVVGSFLHMRKAPDSPTSALDSNDGHPPTVNLTPVNLMASWLVDMLCATQKDKSMREKILLSQPTRRLPLINHNGNTTWEKVLKWTREYTREKTEQQLELLPYSEWHTELSKAAGWGGKVKSLEPFVRALSASLPSTQTRQPLKVLIETRLVFNWIGVDVTQCKALDKKLLWKYLANIEKK